MSDFTPSTEQVRGIWRESLFEGIAANEAHADAQWDATRMEAQFARWYDAEKRKWQAEALREAAAACSAAFATNPDARGKWSRIAADAIETTLTARAERIERTKP